MKASSVQVVSSVSQPDDLLVKMWLHGRPVTTASVYRADALRFLAHSGQSLASVTLADLQAWDDSMASDAPASRNRRLAVVKSLLAFGHKLGYLPVDTGRALRLAKPTGVSAERILTEADVQRMIGAETNPRLRALLRLLYICGLRASEACDLRWRHMTHRGKSGGEAQVTGKGDKRRTVIVPPALWRELSDLTPNRLPDSPVVPARNGNPLDRQAVHRAVKRGARRAGLSNNVSAHFLRHAHASHSLDRGAPVHVVQASLGHASLATTTRYLHVKKGQGSSSYLPD